MSDILVEEKVGEVMKYFSDFANLLISIETEYKFNNVKESSEIPKKHHSNSKKLQKSTRNKK